MTVAPGPVTRAADPDVRLTGWRAAAAWTVASISTVLGIAAAVRPAAQSLWLREPVR